MEAMFVFPAPDFELVKSQDARTQAHGGNFLVPDPAVKGWEADTVTCGEVVDSEHNMLL